MDKKTIGAALQRARKAGGFKSAKAFAEHMGYNPLTYTDWEQGRHTFSFEQAWEMADALHITLDELGGRVFQEKDAIEIELVSCYREATPAEKSALMHVARTYRTSGAALNSHIEGIA